MKRVIGYIRVSTDNQDLERQRVLIRKYCENKGYSLLRIEEDYAISGTVSNRKSSRIISQLQFHLAFFGFIRHHHCSPILTKPFIYNLFSSICSFSVYIPLFA